MYNSTGFLERVFIKHLWFFYGLGVCCLGGLLFISLLFAHNQVKNSAAAQAHVFASSLNEINDRQFETMAVPLEFLAREVEARGGLSRIGSDELNRFFARARDYVHVSFVPSIFAIDKEGQLRGFAPPSAEPPIGKLLRNSEEFNYVKTQKNYSLFTTVSPVEGRGHRIFLSKRLRGRDGSFEGLIAISRSLMDFEHFYKSLDFPLGITFTVTRDDGKVIYRYPEGSQSAGMRIVIPEEVYQKSEGPLVGRSSVDGRNKIGYYKVSKEYGVMTYVGYDTNLIFSVWRSTTLGILFVFLLFVAAMMFLVGLVRKRQVSLAKALEEREAREELIRLIQEKTESLTGSDFLRELGLQIANVFDVPNVIIGVLLPEHREAVKFVFNWVDGALGTDYIYDLKNTPFENLKPGEFFIYQSTVRRIFAHDPVLNHPNVESCMGILLQDSEQQAIGILMVYSDRKITDVEVKRTVLSVFAARAGAELERIHTDEIRKEVEKLREQIEERVFQSEKLASIGTLAEGIAHDFNNILTIILATTESMMGLYKDSPQGMHYLETIRRAGQRARHLVAQISIFSHKEEGTIQLIQIKKVFPEMLDFLHSTLPAQIRVDLDLDDCGDLTINADLNQIQQALLNLCVNAAQSIGINGGAIRITLRKAMVKDRPYVKWSLHYEGGELGQDEIENLFDPFYGQNIGMVVVQRIVSVHQGFIEVHSARGQGTEFEIFLPVIEGAAIEDARVVPFHFKSARKVMIVDDEPEIGLLIKELLENEGLQVEAFVDPLMALEAFTERQNQYFLIISDLSMPKMSGVEFARKVRHLNKTIPMVLWSGYQHFLAEELQELNVKVLSKPVDVQKLLALINTELSMLGPRDSVKGITVGTFMEEGLQ